MNNKTTYVGLTVSLDIYEWKIEMTKSLEVIKSGSDIIHKTSLAVTMPSLTGGVSIVEWCFKKVPNSFHITTKTSFFDLSKKKKKVKNVFKISIWNYT